MTKATKRRAGFSDLFSFSLYLQGLKRLLIPGIIGMIVIVVPSFLMLITSVPLRLILPSVRADEAIDVILLGMLIIDYSVTFLSSHSYIIFFAVASVLIVFSFLNKRRECDFYHALPCSRLCLFNSFYLAAITWVMTIFIPYALFTLTSRFVLLSFDNERSLSYLMAVAPALLFAIIFALFIMSTLIFAKSITGTLFSNVLALIAVTSSLFRFFVYIAKHIYETAPMIFTYAGTDLESTYQTVISTLALIANRGPLFAGLGSVVVIMALATPIYSILAAVAFCKRRSEIAGNSTVNRVTLHLLCGLLVLPSFVFVISTVRSLNISTIISLIIASIGPIIVFLVSELILSKSFKRMLKSIPVLVLTVAVALSCVLGVDLATDIGEKHILRSLPEADDIKSISVVYDVEQISMAMNCNLTNNDELEFLSSRIKQYYENYDEHEGYTSLSTRLVMKNGKRKTYTIKMSDDDQVLLYRITDSNMCVAFLRNALYSDSTVTTYDSEQFPVSSCTTKIVYHDQNGNLCRFTADEELLKVMLSELESMSAFDRTSIYNVPANYSYSNSEKLGQNQYGIMIRIAIDPQAIAVGSNYTYYSFYADAEGYPMIHDAIEKHIAAEYPQNQQ